MQMWKWKQNEDGGKEFGDERGAREWSEKASVCVCVRQMWFTEAQHWLKLQQGSRSILHPHPPSPSFALYSLTLSLTLSRALTEVFLRAQTGAELQSDSSVCVCLCVHAVRSFTSLPPLSGTFFFTDTGAVSAGSHAAHLRVIVRQNMGRGGAGDGQVIWVTGGLS